MFCRHRLEAIVLTGSICVAAQATRGEQDGGFGALYESRQWFRLRDAVVSARGG